DALLDQVGVVDVARADLESVAQGARIDRVDVRHHIDGADAVLAAFIDGEGDDEALLGRVVFADSRNDAHGGIAVLEVKTAKQVAVGFHPVWVVDVAGLQEAQPVALRGLDHILQPARRIGMDADEVDFLDAGFSAIVDLEHQIDAVIRQFDDLRIDLHVEAAVAVIDFDDPLHVSLHGRPRQGAARLRLDFGLELFVFGFFVAFEGDAIDHRVFDHGDHQPAAGMIDLHILEQTGRNQRLESFVFKFGGQVAARAGLEIRADGLRFDAPVAAHLNGIGGLCKRSARGRHAHDASTDRDTPEDHTANSQSP